MALEKIFEDGLVAAEVRDSGGRGALVFVEGGRLCGSASVLRRLTAVNTVVLEDDGAFGAGNFDAAGIAGVRAVVAWRMREPRWKFEDGGGGVFGFDLVKSGRYGLAQNTSRGARGASRRCGHLD